jgi:mannose-6-phosphate isomerase-like protein (cupin superfamily)
MKRIFQQRGYFEVPDGTEVSPFLNATDANQTDVPWGLIGEMSIAAGRIGPGVQSWVHVHPVITQVTYVVSGDLAIRMKDPSTTDPYDLELRPGQAVVTEPGTLFQLRNMSNAPAEVLYIVSPAYVFEMEGGEVAYDDAIMVAKSWEELEAKKYEVPALRRRAEALRRLATRKGE